MFCRECGYELPDNAKFCSKCGARLAPEETGDRKEEYEGKLYKCPNCGQVLRSFLSHCPSCGMEFRGKTALHSVRELANKLHEIDCREYKESEDKSILKSLVGLDLGFINGDKKREKRIEEFEIDKENDKQQLILNFPIPNDKEDLLEFSIMASTNIDSGSCVSAWETKMKQVYDKAEIIMKDDPDFISIKRIYDSIYERKRSENLKQRMSLYGSFWLLATIYVGTLVFTFSKENAGFTVLVVAIYIVITILMIFGIKRKYKNKQ